MKRLFVSGSKNIRNLDKKVTDRLKRGIDSGDRVIVGDAEGVDTAVQDFLKSQGTQSVTIYCTGDSPRNNLGRWETKHVISSARPGSRDYFVAKDIAMADDCDYGLLVWDTKSSGTLGNAIELLRRSKISLVYVNTAKEFVKIKDVGDLEYLLHFMNGSSFRKVDKKLDVQKKIEALRFSQAELFGSKLQSR